MFNLLISFFLFFLDLQNIPRRIVSGVLSHHIYLEIDEPGIINIMESIEKLEIENVFIVSTLENAKDVLKEVNIHLR